MRYERRPDLKENSNSFSVRSSGNGQITDDDVMQAEGSLDKVVGRIKERSGEERKAIEKWFKSRGV
jgi:hypothetical protein